MKRTIVLDGSNLKLEDLTSLLQGDLNVKVEISSFAEQHIQESRYTVDQIIKKKLPIYGISTGFGKFKEIYIPHEEMVDLQKNLIISHATCVGEAIQPNIVLIMMILRLNCLVRGFSGVRLSLLYSLQEAINKKLIPKVPCQGSVGASGDLAPLSHLALGLMGIGEIWQNDTYVEANKALEDNDFQPIVYQEKEGLAMNNGTQMMASFNLESVLRSKQIMNAANLAFGLTALALKSNLSNIIASTCNRGQTETLDFLKKLYEDNYPNYNQFNPKSIQNSLTIHESVNQTIIYSQQIIEREINSTSDNPIIDNIRKTARSGGNFHGEYMAMMADTLSIALQRLAIYSERRQERLVNSEIGQCGLPMFLTSKGGMLNGYMIPQYTSAAIVSENKVLTHPSCIDTIPTSANIEDHVSMGGYGARKALQVVKNTEYVISIELMCAIQGLDYYTDKLPNNVLQIKQYIRELIPDVKNQDIFMSKYIEIMADEIKTGRLDKLMKTLQLI